MVVVVVVVVRSFYEGVVDLEKEGENLKKGTDQWDLILEENKGGRKEKGRG